MVIVNEKNLIPFSERTESEARELGAKGGVNSGRTRRKKRDMKQCAELILGLPANSEADWDTLIAAGISLDNFTEEEITNILVVNAALVNEAKSGNVKAFSALRDVIRDDEHLKIEKERLKLEKQKLEPERSPEKNYLGIPADMAAPPFLPVIHDIAAKRHSEYIFPGGRGSGKSSFVGLEVIDLIMKNPMLHACVLRQVEKTIRDSVHAQLLWAIDALGLGDEFTATRSPLEITRKSTGQKIFFRGADEPGKIKSLKPNFGYIGIIWFEELDQFKGPESVRQIEQSVIRGGDVAYNFKTFNPPRSASNWANKYILNRGEKCLVTKSTYLDVPGDWLGQAFLDNAELTKQINPSAYENEYLGAANGNGGNVFDNVTVRKITDDEINTFGTILHGVDWGWYPDPYNYERAAYDASHRRLFIYREYRCSKKSNRETADILINEFGITSEDILICDSAEQKSVGDYRAYGLSARGAEKGPGSVNYSMKWLQSLTEIVIDPDTCPYAAEEFLSYEYERTKDGEVITGYPDANNHAIDAVRYATSPIWKKKGK